MQKLKRKPLLRQKLKLLRKRNVKADQASLDDFLNGGDIGGGSASKGETQIKVELKVAVLHLALAMVVRLGINTQV